MSNGDLETRVASLEGRVGELENTLTTLIANLAANNSTYLDALDALAQGGTNELQATVSNIRAGICTNIPPGCHN